LGSATGEFFGTQIGAVSVCAQAQSPSVPRVSKDDAQKVVAIISGDTAKIKNYCDILKLGEQMERAYENRDRPQTGR
jgi:hypothetical protein